MVQNTTVEKICYYLLLPDCKNLEAFIQNNMLDFIVDTDEKKFIQYLIEYYKELHKMPSIDNFALYNQNKIGKELFMMKYNTCKTASLENVDLPDLLRQLKIEFKEKSIKNTVKNLDITNPDALDKMIRELQEVKHKTTVEDENVKRSNVYENTDKTYEQILKNKDILYITTNIDTLDKALNGGFTKGNIYLFFGRNGTGKSRLMFHFAYRAITTGFRGIYISFEMTHDQINYFYISKVSGLSYNQISHGNVDKDFLKDTMDLIKRNENPLGITENIGIISFNFIVEEVRRSKKEGQLDFIVVDYLEHLTMDGYKNRWDELGAITLALHKLAIEENIVIITAQQQNRTKVEEEEKVDTRFIAGSDKIGARCDFVANIKREKKMEENVKLDLFICKNRFGESDKKVNLLADFDHLDFKDVLIPQEQQQTSEQNNNGENV